MSTSIEWNTIKSNQIKCWLYKEKKYAAERAKSIYNSVKNGKSSKTLGNLDDGDDGGSSGSGMEHYSMICIRKKIFKLIEFRVFEHFDDRKAISINMSLMTGKPYVFYEWIWDSIRK